MSGELARAERMLKIAQAARVWNVSERTVWRDIKAGKITPVISEAGRIRIPVSALALRPRVQPLPTLFPRCGVYFAASDTLIKIGSAIDVAKRFTALCTGSPIPLRLIGWIRTEDRSAAFRLEQETHALFGDVRAHGEWFRLTAAQVRAHLNARQSSSVVVKREIDIQECDRP